MKKLSFLLITCICFSGMFFSSCEKSRLNKQTITAEDNQTAQNMYDDVYKNVNEVAVKEEGVNKMGNIDYTFGANCAAVSLTPSDSTFPKTLTIDFGSSNCQGDDGKNRRGKIIAVLTGRYKDTGTKITVTLDNYHVNDYKVEGTKVITNQGNNTFSIVVSGAKITSPDGTQQVSWESTRTRKWIAGYNTNVSFNPTDPCYLKVSCILDDVYEVTGEASGVNRDGRNFTAAITTALRVQFCGWIPEITQGVIEITPEDLKTRKIDFGNGACDNEATVEIGNRTKTIPLRR
jgi:hypothetical protein